MKGLNRILSMFSSLNELTANIACWLCLPLIGVITYEVISRYIFLKPTGWSYDLTWMLYGAIIFLGAGYTHLTNSHVRVDVVYNRFPVRLRAFIEVICYCVLFFPITYTLVKYSYKLAYSAWVTLERSPYALWRPLTGPIKTVMFIGLALLLLQGVVDFVSHVAVLLKGERYDS